MPDDPQSTGFRLIRLLAAATGCILFLLGMSACSSSRSQAVTGQFVDPTGVSSQILLHSETLVSGSNEQGTLVIKNNAEKSIAVGCLRIEVQLVNSEMPVEIHPTPSCPPGTLPVGTTRLPFTLKGSQAVCAVPNGTTASPGDCKRLPAGTYRTQLYPGSNIPDPPAVAVEIVADT
jgi:hypothetical protein